jgi:PAS domain S-box-containing protein
MINTKYLFQIFEVLPTPSLIVLPDDKFTIIEVNFAYLKVTCTSKDFLIGKGIFEAFPDNPNDKNANGVSNLRSSLLAVIESKLPHKMDKQKHDIPIRGTEKFEVKYWQAENVPVLSKKGEVEYIIHSIIDFTKDFFVLEHAKEDLLRNVKEMADYKYAINQSSIVAFANHKGIITYVNDNFCKISKYSNEELIGQDHRIVNSGYHSKEFMHELWHTIASGKIWKGEIKNRAKDGSYYWVDTVIVPFLNEKEEPFQYLAIRTDITKRKEEEHHLKLLESVIVNTNDAVVITDAEPFDEPGPRIVYVNEAFTRMTGYTADEVIGKTPRILQGLKSNMDELKRIGQCMRKWQPCETTIINYKKNGEEFWINFSLNPVADEKGWFTHWISIERDVTQKKSDELQKSLLAEISKIFSETDLLNKKLDKVLKKIALFAECSIAEIWLVSSTNKRANLVANYIQTDAMKVFYEETNNIKSFVKGEGLPGYAWETKKLQVWNDIDTNENFVRKNAAKKIGLKSAYALPLIFKEEIVGILIIALKSINETRLGFTELLDSLGRHLGAEIKRKQLSQELGQIFNYAADIICIVGMDGYFKKINPAGCDLLEYTEDELLNTPIVDFLFVDEGQINLFEKILDLDKTSTYFENRCLTKSGKIKWLAWTSTPYIEEGLVFAVAKDITEKKKLENLLDSVQQMAKIGGWEVDFLKKTTYWSSTTKKIYEVDEDFVPRFTTALSFLETKESQDIIINIVTAAIERGTPWDIEIKMVTTNGNEKWVRVIGEAEFIDGKCVRLYGSFQDIDDHKKSELAVVETLKEKTDILESIDDAFFTVDGNWIVTYWNNRAEKVLKRPKEDILGKNLWEVYSDAVNTLSYVSYHRALRENVMQQFQTYYDTLDSWYDVTAYPSNNGLSVYFKDITERKKSEIQLNQLNNDLQRHAKELAISNKELEQFAYVASHDLQEPLRMVTSFLTQFEKKYGMSIDERGKKYIHFAVDGAKRMRQIILDLLEFSRIGRVEDKLEEVNLDKLVEEILILYRNTIQEQHATVKIDLLPTLKISMAPIRQVFQNIIGNSLKYHKENVRPEIKIHATEKNDCWEFAVSDNGIGIDPIYFDKIFIIFQRLHNKEEYSGTGMGLAITKKIIENMGGRIWLDSKEGAGSTFYFTIPK